MRLEGKVAIITGAGSGIGEATAKRFAQEGAELVLNDLRENYLDALARDLGEPEHVQVLGDISEEDTARRLASAAVDSFGQIDILVNNVGELFFKDITETTVEEWDRLMAVNVRGMFLTCKHVIPLMLKQGGGSIINLASISAFIGQEMGGQSSVAYNVTKAAARQIATSLASRYAADGIRVNAVAPGATRTNQVRHFIPQLSEDEEDAIWNMAGSDLTPVGRVGTPEEIANAILFLASDEASFITGSVIVADGGYLAR